MPLVFCLIGHVVSLPFYIIYIAGKGFSHLYSFLVLQIAICSFYPNPVNNLKKKKKSPFLEFHHFGIDKQVKKAAKRKHELEEVNSH